LIGDLYLNFGIPSVVIGMIVLGVLLRIVQTRLLGPSPTAVGILTVMVVLVQVVVKQMGTIGHTLSATVFALAPVFVVYLAVPFFVRRGRQPSDFNLQSAQSDAPMNAGSG
jgi:membrane protein implicated in regulation of membrane protease activity